MLPQDTQRPVSHGLGQNFDGGAGFRCPAVFSTGYGAHQGKKPGVLGAHAFIVLGTVPIMSKPAPLDPAQFSLSRHAHPVQNGEIFFVSMSLGEKSQRLNSHNFFSLTYYRSD